MHIHCSGIGGIGLSAYASLQKAAGHDVSGSDRSGSPLLEELAKSGIAVSLDQSGAAIPKACNLFVYSEAIPADAPERKEAESRNIPQESYPQALGNLSRGKRVIAVCGTHGKSSTTAMAGRVLLAQKKDPSIVVGTKMKELEGKNWRKGESDLFLLEACEYRNSFLHYDPAIILLTNCDGDHFDFYESHSAYLESFITFVKRLPEDGILITHMKDNDCRFVAERSGKKVIDADAYPMVSMQTPGKHMQQNAQLVLALSDQLGISHDDAASALSGYAGSWRRMELRGTTVHTIPVIDDYGHHPKEIAATLEALAGAYKDNRIVCVFQPHTHDRTLKLYKDFVRSFSHADIVVIPNIYVARKDIEHDEVDMKKFIEDIASQSEVESLHGKSLEQTESLLKNQILKKGDVLVCMGAGDITDLASRMVTAQ